MMINFLRSRNAVLTVLILALVPQMAHAQHVFYSNGQDDGWFSYSIAWAFALALESAVLVFAMRGHVRESWAFAGSSILINVSYYGLSWSWGVGQVLLISAVLPIAIALYSHEVNGDEVAPSVTVKRKETKEETVKVTGGATPKLEAKKQEVMQIEAIPAPAGLNTTAQSIVQALEGGATTQEEVAESIGKSVRTVSRYWHLAEEHATV